MSTSASLVTTVRNEARGIDRLLHSIVSQSRMPNQVVIVDGGSTDGTAEIVSSFFDAHSELNGQLIIARGANIARGRNVAIAASAHEHVAVTDGGCTLEAHWFERIVAPFDKPDAPDIVAGYYSVDAHDYFERCAGALLVPRIESLHMERFLPSSRSIAFSRTIWRKVGGYPEHIYNAEDTLFDRRMLATGAKMELVPDAIVHWRPRTSVRRLSAQFYNYRKSDVEAGLWKRTYLRSMATTSLLIGTVVFPWLLPGFLLAMGVSMSILFGRLSRHERHLLPGLLPLRLVQELSECIGLAAGAFKRIVHVK